MEYIGPFSIMAIGAIALTTGLVIAILAAFAFRKGKHDSRRRNKDV